MVENRTFKKEMGNRYIIGALTIVVVAILFCAKNYIAAAMAAIYLMAVIFQSLYLRKRFNIFLKCEEELESKSVREKISRIISNRELQELYLHYGSLSSFELFDDYFETMSEHDPIYFSTKKFLEWANEVGRFNQN